MRFKVSKLIHRKVKLMAHSYMLVGGKARI